MPQTTPTIQVCGLILDVRSYEGDLKSATTMITYFLTNYDATIKIEGMGSYAITLNNKTLRSGISTLSIERMIHWLSQQFSQEPEKQTHYTAQIPSSCNEALLDFGGSEHFSF